MVKVLLLATAASFALLSVIEAAPLPRIRNVERGILGDLLGGGGAAGGGAGGIGGILGGLKKKKAAAASEDTAAAAAATPAAATDGAAAADVATADTAAAGATAAADTAPAKKKKGGLLGGLLGGLGGGAAGGGLGALLGGGGAAGGGANIKGLLKLLNPADLELNKARLQTLGGVTDAQKAVATIQADATAPAALQTIATDCAAGLTKAAGGINNIKNDLLSGATPKTADRDTTEAGIKQAKAAVDKMAAAAGAGAGAELTSAISDASSSIDQAVAGGTKILELDGANGA